MAKAKNHPDYDVSDNTYNLKRQNLKDKDWDTEIGDRRNANRFIPRVKIQRWEDAFIEIGIHPSLQGGGDTITHDGDAIIWSKGIYTVKFYDWANDPDDEEGNGSFEWEFILASEPPVNSFSVDIRRQNVRLYYQPILTAQEMADQGVERPDRVQGSYAVYHNSKRWHKAGETDYEVGKIGHLYRPKVTDASGNWIWGEWNTDAEASGQLTLTVDAGWLASAIYPITIDPTFGYTTAGGSIAELLQSQARANGNATYQYAATAGDTITTLYFYGNDFGDAGAVHLIGVYDVSSGVANNLVGSTTIEATNTTQWWSGAVSLGLSGSTTYTLVIKENTTNGARVNYDTGSAGDTDTDTIASPFLVFNDPFTDDGDLTHILSLKADYTEGGGAARRVMVVS